MKGTPGLRLQGRCMRLWWQSRPRGCRSVLFTPRACQAWCNVLQSSACARVWLRVATDRNRWQTRVYSYLLPLPLPQCVCQCLCAFGVLLKWCVRPWVTMLATCTFILIFSSLLQHLSQRWHIIAHAAIATVNPFNKHIHINMSYYTRARARVV